MSKIKEKAAQYKKMLESKIIELNLKDNHSYMIASEKEGVFYTITKSLYKSGHIQLTTFIHSKPHSHSTYRNISELLKDFRKAFFTSKEKLHVIESIKISEEF